MIMKSKIQSKKFVSTKILLLLIGILFLFAGYKNFTFVNRSQEFVVLAKSFIQGKTYFVEQSHPLWWDTVLFNNHHYWPQGMFPGILLMPFVIGSNIFHMQFLQGYLSFFLGILIFVLVHKTAKKLEYSSFWRLVFGLGFCFGSAFIGVYFYPSSYHFAQVVTVLILWLIIYESIHKNRSTLIGLLIMTLVLSRLSAALGAIVWLLLYNWVNRVNSKAYIRHSFWLFGLLFGLGITGWYNVVRFGSFFESGYSLQKLYVPSLFAARYYGVINAVHIPGNIFYSLLAMPAPVFRDQFSHVLKFPYLRPDPWGMSVFVTSPYLVYLFTRLRLNKQTLPYLGAIIGGLLTIYAYYGIGYIQYGYRYLLDVFPWIFMLLMISLRQKNRVIPNLLLFIVIFSCVSNLFLLLISRVLEVS